MHAHLLADLRSDLAAASFRVDTLRELWGPAADAALGRGDRVPAARALESRPEPAALLARLFVLGLDAGADEVEAALPRLGLDGAVDAGLLGAREDRYRATLDLRPYDVIDARGTAWWWLASDLGEIATGAALRPDHVLGVGGASSTLAGLQLPGRVGRALDLGTGSGIQALHLAREAEEVVATDISTRALEFAAMTAGLNEVALDLRLGSLFEPVAGERFDRIVSNPPFVITPRRVGVPEYEYRDGGRVGDALLAEVIAGLPEHLAPGGVAQLLGNWEYGTRDGLERAAEWAEDAGLEYWLIERETQDPAAYAETWIRDGGTRPGHPDYEHLVGAWLDDFDARGVTAIGFGYLLLRAPRARAGTAGKARPMARTEPLDATLGDATASLGGHLAEALAAHDTLATLDDDALAQRHLAVAPDVTEERHYWPGDEHPTVMTLRQGGGFRREFRVGTALAAVVGACDGELSLGSILVAVAALLEVDEEALRAEILPEVRELILGGLLRIPASDIS